MMPKAQMRTQTIARRAARGAQATAALSKQVCERLLALARTVDARTVACFASTPLEPPTGAFLREARTAGLRVLVPNVVSDTEMRWHLDTGQWGAPEALGIAQPLGPVHPQGLRDADLVIVPALAVDRAGHRLGRGRGFYDRALAATVRERVVALVHDDEVWDAVAHDPHDVPVAGVVTPTRYFTTGETTH